MDHVVTRGDKKMLHAANMGLVAIVVLLAGRVRGTFRLGMDWSRVAIDPVCRAALGIPAHTARRELRLAHAWLHRELAGKITAN